MRREADVRSESPRDREGGRRAGTAGEPFGLLAGEILRCVMGCAREYVRVVLHLAKLAPDWVETYTVPPDVVAAAEADAPSAKELRESTEELLQRVRGEEPDALRRRWLVAQLRGISAALLWLEGERPGYRALFERCHGAPVESVPESQFEQAHALLDRALPGTGDAPRRYRAWRDAQLIPPGRLKASLELLASEMRRRCRERFELPDGEQVIWEVVSNETWAGNAHYCGQGKTRIRVNADFPIAAPRLLELVCHEAYPGHHTDAVCKDVGLIQQAGRDELAMFVSPTPQALVCEGLACCALEALLGDEAEQIAAECLRPAGIAYDHLTAAAVREAETLLLPVRSNIALMLDDGATSSEAQNFARSWLLDDVEQIDKAIDEIRGRAWRPYESCYPVGLALCRQYLGTDPGRFGDLLNQQLTPADLLQ